MDKTIILSPAEYATLCRIIGFSGVMYRSYARTARDQRRLDYAAEMDTEAAAVETLWKKVSETEK